MLRFTDMQRLLCDVCGAHQTRDVVPGQLCPLCGIGRLAPLQEPPRRPRERP